MKRTLSVIVGALLIIVSILVFALKIQKTNSPPAAMDGSIQTREDTPGVVSLKGSDPDGDSLSYIVLTKPSHGTLSGTEPNLIYTPAPNFNGVDSFTFKVNDGKLDGSHAAISIMVTAVNDPPKAQDDTVEIKEDSSLVIINVLDNDTDVDNDKLTILGAAGSSQGSTIISSDNRSITYTVNKNFSGSDSFTYTISDGAGGTDTATVRIKVVGINDAPVIKSKPDNTKLLTGSKYKYQVVAKDADPEDILTYSLIKKPEGMKINSSTGLIEWDTAESQSGIYDVQIKVEDDNDKPASDTQSFTLILTSPKEPISEVLNLEECFNIQNKEKLPQENKASLLLSSDDKRLEITGNSFICSFSEPNLPEGFTIASVVLYVEHFEDKGFRSGNLKWSIGTGWPNSAQIWDSINAPVHEEQAREAADSWDITSFVNTPEKRKSFQLQINNSSTSQKTSIDNIYAIIKWY